MSANNKMYHAATQSLDFDVCSMYPSAMTRWIFYSDKQNSLNTHFDVHVTSTLNAYGVRGFTNDMSNEVLDLDKSRFYNI